MSRSSRIVLIVIIALVLFSTAGVVWYLKGRKVSNTGTEESSLPAVKISLNNGCGFEGVAKDFADFLEGKNVEIVSMGNASKPIYDKTIIVVRKGDGEDLQRLMRMTGIERYTEARTESALADFEIIIGRDFETYVRK